MSERYVFTSESVSAGHPDKICDRISDAIVDLYLSADKDSRVACETLATLDRIIVAGEVSGPENLRFESIEARIRDIIKGLGYEQEGFDWRNLRIDNYLHGQSSDIALGVADASSGELGAGDQGIMFGYACSETKHLMPAPIYYAHKILYLISQARSRDELPLLGPDAKSQVSVIYEDGVPCGISALVVSSQHAASLSQGDVRDMIRPYVIKALPSGWMCGEENFYVNPTGRFVIGGPVGDAGVTGRKIIVDTYGGRAPHGGGAFSGKDPTKVDRSGAYAARYIAKNVVASGIADECLVQLSYAIGVGRPISMYLRTKGNKGVSDKKLSSILNNDLLDLSVKGIIDFLKLDRPIYEVTSSYGHFGRPFASTGEFSWENTDLAKELVNLV